MNTRYVIFFLLTLTFTSSRSQSVLKQYRALPKAEKRWVRQHPHAALKVRSITSIVRKEVIEYSRKNLVDTLFNGGTADAFRHCYWMALCAQKIGSKKALSLGEAHEKGNREQFDKGLTEDAVLQDSISCLMDLYNNRIGIGMVSDQKIKDAETLKFHILEKIKQGELRVLKRNNMNQFIDCEGNAVIKPIENQRKWQLPYCLVPSNLVQ
jgi:hypothetical protein